MKYAAFDVETPNSQNRRMSAVGVTLLDETGITGNFSFLVNPETHFGTKLGHTSAISVGWRRKKCGA